MRHPILGPSIDSRASSYQQVFSSVLVSFLFLVFSSSLFIASHSLVRPLLTFFIFLSCVCFAVLFWLHIHSTALHAFLCVFVTFSFRGFCFGLVCRFLVFFCPLLHLFAFLCFLCLVLSFFSFSFFSFLRWSLVFVFDAFSLLCLSCFVLVLSFYSLFVCFPSLLRVSLCFVSSRSFPALPFFYFAFLC